MKRFSRFVVLASTVVFVLPFVAADAASATVDDQRREVERVVDMLDGLHAQADILAEDYAVAVDDMSRLDAEIIEARASVAAKEAELAELQGDLGEIAVRAFTGSGADVLGPLFSDPATYSDGLRRDQFSRVALDVGTGTTDDLDELISDLDKERENLEQKLVEAAALKVTIQQKQEETVRLTAEYTERKAEEEARLGNLIQQEEERRAAVAFAAAQAQYAAQQAAAASNSNAGSGSSGGGNNGGADAGGADAGGGGSSTAQTDSGGDTSGGGSAPAAPAPPANVPSVSGLAGTAIQAAMGQLGVPYRYATSLPGVSFDCSGLTHYAWGKAGVYLPRNSRAQAAALPRIPTGAAQPGDLIFYYSPISHVGVYLGGGQLVHAPNSGSVVKTASVNWNKVTAVGRPG